MSDRLLDGDMVLAEVDYLLMEDIIERYLRCNEAYLAVAAEERLIAEAQQAYDVRPSTLP